jgi:hypothetical protein
MDLDLHAPQRERHERHLSVSSFSGASVALDSSRCRTQTAHPKPAAVRPTLRSGTYRDFRREAS